MISRERFLRLSFATAAAVAGGYGDYVANKYNTLPDQTKIIPHGDLLTGRDTTPRSMAISLALPSAGWGIVGILTLLIKSRHSVH